MKETDKISPVEAGEVNGKFLKVLRHIAGEGWSRELIREIISDGVEIFVENDEIVGFQTKGLGDNGFFGRATRDWCVLKPMQGEQQSGLKNRLFRRFNAGLDHLDKDLTKRDRRHGGGKHDKRNSHAKVARATLKKYFVGKIDR